MSSSEKVIFYIPGDNDEDPYSYTEHTATLAFVDIRDNQWACHGSDTIILGTRQPELLIDNIT